MSESPDIYIILAISVALVIFILVYLLPTFIAFKRKHKHRKSICLINIFLGFTTIAWVVSLIWAFVDDDIKNQQ